MFHIEAVISKHISECAKSTVSATVLTDATRERNGTCFALQMEFAHTIQMTDNPHNMKSSYTKPAPLLPSLNRILILTPSCFAFLHILLNLAIMTVIPVITIVRIFQNIAVVMFRSPSFAFGGRRVILAAVIM